MHRSVSPRAYIIHSMSEDVFAVLCGRRHQMLLKKSLQPQRHCICRCLQSAYVCMQKMTHTECVDLTLRNQQQMQPQLKQSRQLQQNNHRNVMAFGLVCILCHVQRSVSQCTGLFLQESSTTTEEKPANTEASATSLHFTLSCLPAGAFACYKFV